MYIIVGIVTQYIYINMNKHMRLTRQRQRMGENRKRMNECSLKSLMEWLEIYVITEGDEDHSLHRFCNQISL